MSIAIPEKPLFLFNVTIQNHGAYTVKDYPAAVDLLDEPEKYPMAQQYLTLINKTEEQFLRLTDYFSQQEEPVLILMFGDHQPISGAGVSGESLWRWNRDYEHGRVYE